MALLPPSKISVTAYIACVSLYTTVICLRLISIWRSAFMTALLRMRIKRQLKSKGSNIK